MIEVGFRGMNGHSFQKGEIMFAKQSKDMSPKTAPLLLTQPVTPAVVQSVDSELTSGPLPDRLTPEDVSKMFKEVTEKVYGAGQKP